jgi:histidinol-phosphate aminotransferase
MSNFDELIPEHVRALAPYIPGKPVRQAERESGVPCIKMASNENPFGPSPRALKAMRDAASCAHHYPDNDSSELRIALAERNGLESDQVMVTAGSTSFLNIIARTLLAPGLNAITSERSFIIYPIATRAAGARLIEVPMQNDTFDLDKIAAAIDRNTRIVYIANPNNPTGTLVPPQVVEDFLARVPSHVIVVVDEAYCDFAQDFAAQRGEQYSRSLDYVRAGRKVVVLRTFSKAHGLAGVRLGYGFGPAALIQYFARLRTAFAVSSVAQAAGMAALEDEAHIRKALDNNRAGAKWLYDRIRELGIRVVPTWANFLYCQIGEDAALIAKRLQDEGIIVRPLTAWGAPDALRVTIGTPEQNERFSTALRKVMARATV